VTSGRIACGYTAQGPADVSRRRFEGELFGRLSASRLIVYGFIALVAGVTALLKLPWATTDGISLVNAFFVAVSCSTVTGLSTVAIPETFTHFGELVMMVLMQLGGLGIMTVTTLAALLVGQRVGFRRLIPYAGNWLIVVALVCVITLGGLGFPVLVDLYHYRQSPRLSVHSRVVLITSSALVVFGVLSVAVMEWTNPHTLGGESMSTKAAMSLFQGVTPRTAGFQTVSYPEMREPTLLVQTVLMFIGTAPTSTGGGIKVTTLALVVLIVAAQVRGQERITLFWRTLPRPLISRALSVLAVASLLVLLSTLALMVSEGLELLPALFEVTSAFGTVGLSLDVTPHLSTFGKVLISVVMFLGRVGPITFIVALAARQRTPHYRYPEEEIAIG
jgi:trk system potassium uptake protein